MESSKQQVQGPALQSDRSELNSFEIEMVAHEMNQALSAQAQGGNDWDSFEAACSAL